MSTRAGAASTELFELLERARRGWGVRAMALADDQGLLIAGAGQHSLCEALAAWAPLSEVRGRVASTQVWGFRVHLCASEPPAGRAAAERVLARARQLLCPELRWVA